MERHMNRYIVIALLFPAISFALELSSSSHPYFQQKEIYLGGKKLLVELANTEQKRQQGLSGRNSLKEGKGMLFIFEAPRRVSFHMKNVGMPLSIGFFNEKQILEQIEHMLPEKKTRSGEKAKQYNRIKYYNSKSLVKYALEVPEHWFSRNKIFLGAKLEGI